MRVLFILGVLFCCISCKKQEESKVRNKIQEETVSQITKEDISKLNFREFILDANTSKEDKAFYLKLLVHFIGDLHQPMHVGRAEDKGGNDMQVRWFDNGTNLHAVWDSKMIDSFDMSYTELASNTSEISKEQVAELQKGTIVDWVNDTHIYAKKVYGSAETGENLRYDYMYHLQQI